MGAERRGVVYVVNKVPEREGTTRYQHATALCESFETTILTRGAVPAEITDIAGEVHRFPASGVASIPILFPFWLWYWVVRTRARVFIVSPHNLFLLAVYAGTRLSASSLVVDLWDDLTLPIASYEQRGGPRNRFRLLYHHTLFGIAVHALPRVDRIVLSIHPGVVEKYDLDSVPVVELTNGYLPPLFERPRQPPDGPTRIVYLGRANAKRGVDEVVRAVGAAVPECRFHVVGPADEAVRNAAAAFDSVTLLGELPHGDAVEVVARADIGLCILDTSVENYRYSYPIKLFEYAALGTAIVASDTPAIRTVLTPGESVRLVSHTESIGDAVTTLVRDESLQRRLGTQAHTEIEPYAWPRIRAKYVSAIEQEMPGDSPTGEPAA